MKLNKTSSSSAQTVASIDDLLIQIFLSIPLKPLVRLKLVSKHWNLIISSESFNLLWNQNPKPAVGFIFSICKLSVRASCPSSYVGYFDKQTNGSVIKFPVSDEWHDPSTYIVSFDKPTDGPLFRTLECNRRWPCETLNSCNGLLLFKRKGICNPNQRYCVCNPTTNKYFMLPEIDRSIGKYYCSDYWMCLAFDPSKSHHYKVVCVTAYRRRNQLQVYSSETGCWRKHGEPFSAGVDFSRGVYWNGANHWISLTITGQSLYFNPDNDRVPQVMPTPPMITDIKPELYPSSRVCRYFGESCGHLHYIDDHNKVTELNVYEMRTDYSEWFVKYRVDCSLIDNRSIWMLCAVVRGKKDEDSFLVLQIKMRIIRYNLVNKTCETICEFCETICEFDAPGAIVYPTWDCPLQYIESVSDV